MRYSPPIPPSDRHRGMLGKMMRVPPDPNALTRRATGKRAAEALLIPPQLLISSDDKEETDPAEVVVSDITFETSDGITISGQLRVPAARPGTKLPTVILIHQGGRTHAEWDPFLPAFSAAGYATLAYDIRGHGASDGSFGNSDFDNPDNAPKDVVAALAFLDTSPTTDPDRIGIVGSSVGGNLACVASQKRWVKTAVNISGKTSAVRNLAAEDDLDLQSMFHISSSGDGGGDRATWANELYGFTSGWRMVEIVAGSSAHGVGVINADPTLLGRIIDWLGETL
jgi:pimeloyl-ACP methyl ester carboxylesterase